MKWYLAKIVFRIVCGDGDHTAQFDEQLRLISANDCESAFAKAATIGSDEEDQFLNARSELVRWSFVNVSEIIPLTTLTHGAELYSRIQEVDDADVYISAVNMRAASLLEASPHVVLETF